MRQLARMPAGRRPNFQHYKVRRGDTLAKVAKRFKVTPDDLLDANDITSRQFKPGRRLLIPPASGTLLDARDLAPKIERVRLLGDRPLDPLPALPAVPAPSESVGDAFSEKAPAGPGPASPAMVGGSGPAVKADPLPSPSAEPASTGPAYRARPGDTLAKIARARKLPLGELMRLNPEAVKALHPGDKVLLPGSASSGGSGKVETTPSLHVVRRGETLAAIGRKYGLDPKDLKAWNRMKGDRIRPGQRLRLEPR